MFDGSTAKPSVTPGSCSRALTSSTAALVSLVRYLLKPAWSQRLSADFEDHAEHEDALFVEEQPEFEEMPFESHFVEDYGRFDSVIDLFRQIAREEREHREESLAAMAQPRLS
ncbi:MAG: hypothetical protein ACRD07_12745 [Acidimicrobiales bacterium]